MALIEVRDVSKVFRIPKVRRSTVREHFFSLFRPTPYETLRVLESVTFEVAQGEALGLMGRNGSGKSTLLKIVSGIYRPDGGEVRTRAPVTSILELGIGWNGELNAVDNILLIGVALGMSLREARGSVEEVLAFAELERFANLELKHYSSGMAMRLAFAVAFQAVREVLVVDEVFAVGDVGFKQRCMERMAALKKSGRTFLLVSHDIPAVSSFCDRALLLEKGTVSYEGTGAEVSARYRSMLQERPALATGS